MQVFQFIGYRYDENNFLSLCVHGFNGQHIAAFGTIVTSQRSHIQTSQYISIRMRWRQNTF